MIFAIFVIFKGGQTFSLPESKKICYILLQYNIFKLKIRAALNSRSSLKIASGAQLSAHFPAKERRSTRAREVFLALT